MEPDAVEASAGYEAAAQEFMRVRHPSIGVAAVRRWAGGLPPGAAVLDLGCGHGVPIAESLIADGFHVHGVDAAPTMVAAFRERFPQAPVACERVEESSFFGRTFDAVVAWGIVFLLPPDAQVALLHRIAAALPAGGRLLFTAPAQAVEWTDVLTGRQLSSLGAEAYRAALAAAGFTLVDEHQDEAGNHHYEARKR